MFKAILITVSLICSFPVFGNDGYVEFEKKDDSVTYIHPRKTMLFPELKMVGIKEFKIFNKPQSSPIGNFRSINTTKLCDCKNQAVETVRISVWDKDYPNGSLIFEKNFKDNELKWEPLVKGSRGEALCDIACSLLTYHQ